MTTFSRSRAAWFVAGTIAPLSCIVMACAADDPSVPEGGAALPEASLEAAPDARVPDDAVPTWDARSDATVDASALEVACSAQPCVVQLSGGGSQICARTSTGLAYCWGNDACGEIPPPLTDGGVPVDAGRDAEAGAPTAPFVPGIVAAPRAVLKGVAFISVGLGAGCAVLDGGALECWGGLPAAMKPGTCSPPLTPKTIAGLPPLVSVTASATGACGVSWQHEVWCWGSNPFLLARTTCTDPFCDSSDFPPGLADLGGAKTRAISAFATGAYAVDETGQLRSWGANPVLGRPTQFANDTPFPITGMNRVSSVSASTQPFDVNFDARTCAVSNGVVYCWGLDYSGAGSATPQEVALPVDQTATGVSVGDHACATTLDGSVYCWGVNTAGQLGDGTGIDQPFHPVKVQGLAAKAVQVVATDVASCALLVTGAVQCWGGNFTGQLGLGAADHLLHFQPRSVVFP